MYITLGEGHGHGGDGGHNDRGGRGGVDIELNLIVIGELNKVQKQLKDLQLKQDIESKKQNLLQNLVLDLNNSKRDQTIMTEPIGKCVICLDKPLTHAVRPCRHLIACTDCAKKILKECPICRCTISDILKIFFP